MNIRKHVRIFAFAFLLSGISGQAGAGDPGPDAKREILHLLQYLEASQCAFYRNGTWRSSLDARAHLEEKYRYLQNLSLVSSAEDFLARAATSSSLSGIPYQVRCDGQPAVESAAWLGSELKRYRATGTDSRK
jgi:hypothetical protein